MATPFSIDNTQPTATPPVSIDVNSASVPITPDAAAIRSSKVAMAFPDLGSSDDIFSQIMAGQEQRLREAAAVTASSAKDSFRQEALAKIAAAKGGQLTSQEQDYVTQLISAKNNTDPQSVFEEYYSAEWLDGLKKTGNIDWQGEEARNILNERLYGGRDWMSMQELMKTQVQNLESTVSDQSTMGWLVDKAKGFASPYWQLKQRNSFFDLFKRTLGADLEMQSKAYFDPSVPFETRKDRLLTDLAKFKNDNPSLALEWLHSMLGQSQDQYFWNSLFGVADVPAIGGAAKLTKFGVSKFLLNREANDIVRTAVQAGVRAEPTLAARSEAMGSLQEAGVLRAMKELYDTLKPMGPTSKITDLSPELQQAGRELFSTLRPGGPTEAVGGLNAPRSIFDGLQSYFRDSAQSVGMNPGRHSREFVNRIAEDITSTGSRILDTIYSSLKVERLPALKALENGVREAARTMAEDYPGLRNTILDGVLKEDVGGLNSIEFQIGMSGTEYFPSRRKAEDFIRMHNLKKEGVTIENQGTGFFISMTKPLPENHWVIRDGLLATGETKTPMNWLNGSLVGRIRTPDETMSFQQTLNRKAATYSISNLMSIAKDIRKEINQLQGWKNVGIKGYGTADYNKWQEWNRIVEDSRSKGFYRDIPELEHNYQNTLQRLPDPQEIKAYFATKRLEQTYEIINRINEYKGLHRLGAETHTISIGIPERETSKAITLQEHKFDGIKVGSIPARDDRTILVVGRNRDAEFMISANQQSKKLLNQLERGEKVAIKVANPEKNEFEFFGGSKVGDDPVHYVVVDADRHTRETLSLGTRELRPLEYDYEHYLVQPIVRYSPTLKKYVYQGDRKIAALNLRALGNELGDKLNPIVSLIKQGKEVEAQQAFANSGLPINWDKFRGWFNNSVSTEGINIKSRLNLDERIQVVPRNQRSIDMHKELEQKYGDKNFVDGTREGYSQYLNGLHDIDDLFAFGPGTKGSPLYNVAPAKQLDPLTSINRALTRVVNSNFLDDYKTFSVEHWIKEAEKWLAVSREQLQDAPLYYFHNAASHWKPGTPPEVKNALTTVNLQIKQLLGIQNATTTFLHSATQKLADSIYGAGFHRAALIPAALLPVARDPFSYIRSMAFHAKLGLFNPAQLLVQMNTFANIYGIAGFKNASAGTAAASLHLWSSFNRNPEILAHMGKLAEGFGFKPGEWEEANRLAHSVGILNVGAEHAYRDLTTNSINMGGNAFLNAGQWFFQWGSKSTRTGAWYTAYKEFRATKPVGALTDMDVRKILNRADLLDNNMTRASSSIIHQGIFSTMAQFQTYTLRQMELFLGKRLTGVEKARLFAVNATLYGLPVATGLTAMPFPDIMRKSFIEAGYVPGNDAYQTMVAEGLLSTMGGLISGGGDLKKGTFHNIGERFGPQPFAAARDLIRSDKTWWDVVMGASGSTLKGGLEALHPYEAAFMSYFRGEGQDYSMHIEDLLKPFQEVSSVNNAMKLYTAVNSAKLVSKGETPLTDVTKSSAIFQFLTGSSPQTISDMSIKTWIRQDEKNVQEKAGKNFEREWRRGIQEMTNDNPTQAAAYFKNAWAWLKIADYPEEEISTLIARTSKGYEDAVNNVDWSFFERKVPESRKAAAKEQELRKAQGK